MPNIEHWDPSSENLQLAAEPGTSFFFLKNDFPHTKRDKEKKVICNPTAQIIPATSDGGEGTVALRNSNRTKGRRGKQQSLSQP